jgi:F-type H+-transporting ATPase subunit b
VRLRLALSRAGVAAALALPSALAAAAAEREGGMPQLNFGNPLTISQIVWMAIIFFVLYIVVTLWGLPRVDAVLAERSARIAADLDTARAAKAQSVQAAAELAEATRGAHAEAQATIADALARAKQAATAEALAFNERWEAQLKAAEQRIGEARAAAMGALRQVAAETGEALIRRLTGSAADRQAIEAAVATALAARRT